jgi:hypothetical protein
MLLAAARRFLVLLGVTSGVIALCSLAIGLIGSFSLNRSLAIGFEAVGAFLLVAGFFVGNRGPVRLKGDAAVPMLGPRYLRWATREEHQTTINESAIFVVLGLVVVVIGLAIDNRYRLL